MSFGIGRAHGQTLERALATAHPGDVEALLTILRSHARSLEADDPEQSLRCRAVIGYVEHNAQAIANYRIMPMASSGPMEKGVDLVVLVASSCVA
jgi:hypothetical protein